MLVADVDNSFILDKTLEARIAKVALAEHDAAEVAVFLLDLVDSHL